MFLIKQQSQQNSRGKSSAEIHGKLLTISDQLAMNVKGHRRVHRKRHGRFALTVITGEPRQAIACVIVDICRVKSFTLV